MRVGAGRIARVFEVHGGRPCTTAAVVDGREVALGGGPELSLTCLLYTSDAADE